MLSLMGIARIIPAHRGLAVRLPLVRDLRLLRYAGSRFARHIR
jgi:hypothetical protein